MFPKVKERTIANTKMEIPGPMHKRYLAVFVVLALALGGEATATTVVYAISSSGIAVGADGKTTSETTALKIALLKDRLAVATLYTVKMRKDGGVLVYDFESWIKQIDDQTDANISVRQLVATIKNQMPTAFAYCIDAIRTGEMTKEDFAKFGAAQYLVQYVIAGYEKGVPLVYSLTLMPDWETKTVKGPFQVLLQEGEPKNAGLYYGWRGRGVAIAPIGTAGSQEQRDYNARTKAEREIINSGNSLTTYHLSNVARVLLEMEAKANPRYVGFPLTVVSIPKIGSGSTATYHSGSTVPYQSETFVNASAESQPVSKPTPPSVFILSNGDRLESSHYLLTVDSLRVQQGQTERTIPMSAINMNATIAANRERGIELKIPKNKAEIALGF